MPPTTAPAIDATTSRTATGILRMNEPATRIASMTPKTINELVILFRTSRKVKL